MTGASPAAMVAMAEGMGADAIGANCSLEPKQMRGVVAELLANASIPVLLKPNAGLPQESDGKAVYATPVSYTHLDVYKRQLQMQRLLEGLLQRM